ncbi:MAG TPA: type II secretion system protein [Candidatus Paceibacterota bacterium]|nr:type II secretion system protein [Candidatus Paceibacterota bacterium]
MTKGAASGFIQPRSACGKRCGAGFTLIETIVVIAMTALIMVTLGTLLSYFYKTNAYTLEQSSAVAQARRSVEDAMHYMREASYGSDGSYPIESAATSSITFYANVISDSAIERVTYTLQSGTLYRTVAEPAGNPPSYAGALAATTTVASSIVNDPATPIFRYFDDSGAELAAPVDVSKVASIETTVVIDTNINRAPVSFTLSGGATLRNLKTQL